MYGTAEDCLSEPAIALTAALEAPLLQAVDLSVHLLGHLSLPTNHQMQASARWK